MRAPISSEVRKNRKDESQHIMAGTVCVCPACTCVYASMLTGDKDTISGFQMFRIKTNDFHNHWYKHYAIVTQLNA